MAFWLIHVDSCWFFAIFVLRSPCRDSVFSLLLYYSSRFLIDKFLSLLFLFEISIFICLPRLLRIFLGIEVTVFFSLHSNISLFSNVCTPIARLEFTKTHNKTSLKQIEKLTILFTNFSSGVFLLRFCCFNVHMKWNYVRSFATLWNCVDGNGRFINDVFFFAATLVFAILSLP